MSEDHDPPERRRFCPSCRTEVDLDASNCPTCWRPLPIGSGYVDAPFDDSSSAPLATVAANPPLAIDRSVARRPPITTPPLQKALARDPSPPPSTSRHIPALARARTGLAIVVGSLALLWIIQIVNNADHYRLSADYGIKPRLVGELPYILTAPFLHLSWAHIEGNSLPFLVLGFLVAYRSVPKFLWVTAVVILTSGLAVWLTSASSSDTVGASGVIFGWFGYVMVRGFFNRNKVDIVVGLLVFIYYLPIFTLLVPAPHLSYEGHLGGLIGGVACGWIFRVRDVSTGGTEAVRRT